MLMQNRIGESPSVALVVLMIPITRSTKDCRAWRGTATSNSRHDPLTTLCNRAMFQTDGC